jgi:peroxiredoxin Q/BCP
MQSQKIDDMLKPGDKAPEFTGRDQDGNEITLSQFKGKKLVLYFYPKDDTPGCTAEACDLRDNYERFLSMGYQVVGVSKDSEKSHKKFIEKYNLPFPLISDTETSILQAYGAWGKKKFMGREYDGIIRKTFVIDQTGLITDIIEKVNTKAHSSQILPD